MINLLPPAEKRTITKEYKHRVIVTYLVLIILAMIISFILLLPAYFLINVVDNDLEREVAILENSNESTERQLINDELKLTKERLFAITKEETRPELYEVIETISEYGSRGIALKNFSYSKGSGEDESKLLIGGNSSTRDSLLFFTRAMESDELFGDVDLPVSSLAKERDIDFNIEVKGTF